MNLWKKPWDWYKGLPWWGKILGGILLLAILILAVLSILSKVFAPGPRITADLKHKKTVDEALEGHEELRKKLEETVRLKKRVLYKAINTAENIDAQTLERRKEIGAATSMGELDELQKKLGL